MQYSRAVTDTLSKARHSRCLALVCRLVLGGTFIIAGIGKLPYGWELFVGLPDILRVLNIPESLWQYIQLQRLPVIEIGLGSFIIAGLLTKPAALVSILLTLAFFIFNGAKILLPDIEWCNCFGQTLQLSLPLAQAIDIALFLMALLLLFHRNIDWSLDSWLLRKKK